MIALLTYEQKTLCFIFIIVPVILRAQSIYLKPHIGFLIAYSRWKTAPNPLHAIDRKGNWFPTVGFAVEFQKNKWIASTGLSVGVISHYVQKYNRLDSIYPGFASYSEQGGGIGTITFPLEVGYGLIEWKDKMKLSVAGGFSVVRSLSVSSNSRVGGGDLVQKSVYNIGWGLSSLIGLRTVFLKNGNDNLTISLLYQRGLQDMLRTDVFYEYDRQKYTAQAASRGSYFAVQVSKSIRLYESATAKQQRIQTLFLDSTRHPPVQRLTDWRSGQFRAYAKGMYFPGTVENTGNVDVGLQYILARRLAINVGLYHYAFTYKLSERRFSQYYATASLAKYFRGRYANPYLSAGLGYDLKRNNGWYPLADGGVNLKLTERSRLDVSTRLIYIRSRSSWQWIPVNFGYSYRLQK